MTFLYFAYGSNMLTEWLRDRCPSAKPIGIAVAANHKLVFGKRSVDKSGKATLVPADGINTPGIMYEIAEGERQLLDAAEGFKNDKPDDPARYGRNDDFHIQLANGDGSIAVTTYLANQSESGLKPYDWYLALLIAGARQHAFDQEYVDTLMKVEFDVTNVDSPKPENRQRAIDTLASVGWNNLEALLKK